MVLLTLALAVQLQIPDPVGYVNDFAGIIDPASQRAMLAVIDEVRAKSRAEIVVVTLSDLEGRVPADVARDIGRQWGVGAQGGPGDRARNAGLVLLLKPGERPGDGKADLFIASGLGAEGFITDARAGRIRDAIGRTTVENRSYAAGLVAGVWLLGQAYAEEFGFELTGAPPVRLPPERRPARGALARLLLFMFVVFVLFASTARRRRHRGRH